MIIKPTCIAYTNTYLYNFQTCGFPRSSGAGIRPLKSKLYYDETVFNLFSLLNTPCEFA